MGQVDIHLYKTEEAHTPKKELVRFPQETWGWKGKRQVRVAHSASHKHPPSASGIPSSSTGDAGTGQENCRAIFSSTVC